MINTFTVDNPVDFSDDKNYPCNARLWNGDGFESFANHDNTFYGFAVLPTILVCKQGFFIIRENMHFCVTGPFELFGGGGVLIERINYKGLFSIGGPIEERGRLRYIDGCTDTLLVPPPRMGDPCLNHLHFPPHISQTMHTHPTVRIGIVAKGRGRCVTPDGEYPLVPGVGWFLPVDGAHCFFTDEESMSIIAFHPTTDTGPNDEDHPMLNQTFVDGASARTIDEIRTGEGVEIAK